MTPRGSVTLFCVLVCALLAGCGSSNVSAPPTPPPVPKKTADLAVLQDKQATAVARSNATAAAVQQIAKTAVARLQSTANAQTQNQNQRARAGASKGSAPSSKSNPSPPPPPPTAPPAVPTTPPTLVVHILPTATSPPVNHPVHKTPHRTKRPATRSGPVVLASVSCCGSRKSKSAGEKRSKIFAVNGTWLLRWRANCTALANNLQPIIYIAVIPAGSKAPIQFIQEPMPANTPHTGIANENLRGRYFLDVISPCRTFAAVAYGPRGVHVSSATQRSVIAEARTKGQSLAFNAVRTNLLGRSHTNSHTRSHTKSHSNTNSHTNAQAAARAQAEARAKAQFIVDLRTVVSAVRAASKTLTTATDAVDPTVQDYDPGTLQAARDYVAAASQELTAARTRLQAVKAIPKQDRLKTKLGNAIVHLVDAGGLVRKSAADMESGAPDTATSDLQLATAKITTATHQLKHVAQDLTLLQQSA